MKISRYLESSDINRQAPYLARRLLQDSGECFATFILSEDVTGLGLATVEEEMRALPRGTHE